MLLCPCDSPGKNTGVGCHALLQGIFPTQGLRWQADFLPLCHLGSPIYASGCILMTRICSSKTLSLTKYSLAQMNKFFSNTIIVGDFNTPLTSMDRSTKQKINKETQTLNDTMDQLDLIDIYRTFRPKKINFTFFSRAHGTFSRINFSWMTIFQILLSPDLYLYALYLFTFYLLHI